jgi:hypothetical protein
VTFWENLLVQCSKEAGVQEGVSFSPDFQILKMKEGGVVLEILAQ